jgi:hypothetical protein
VVTTDELREAAQARALVAHQEDLRNFPGLTVAKRQVNNMTPNQGNMVVLDNSLVSWKDGDRESLLGDWETEFTVGRVMTRGKEADPVLIIRVFEPYHADAAGRPVMPLWAWKAMNPTASTSWSTAIKLPWLPITKLPVSTWDQFYEASAPLSRSHVRDHVDLNWEGTGVKVLTKIPDGRGTATKGILRGQNLDSNAAAVFQLDAAEKAMIKNGGPGAHIHTFPQKEHSRLETLSQQQEHNRLQTRNTGGIIDTLAAIGAAAVAEAARA